MNDNTRSSFMRDMRRSARVPLRLGVRISARDAGSQTFDASTVVVNLHGAMFECKRKFMAGREIGIATFTGRRAKAKIVWAQQEPDTNGNFFFAAELESPENIFEVPDPPESWKL